MLDARPRTRLGAVRRVRGVRERRSRTRVALACALVASAVLAGGAEADAEAVAAPRSGAGAAATAKPAPAAERAPEVVSAERRWTSRLVEYPGQLAAEGGSYVLEVTVPGPAGVGDGVQVEVGKDGRKVSGKIARLTPLPESDNRVRIAIRIVGAPDLASGMDARLQMFVRDRKVVAVPVEAVRRSGDGATVVLVDASGATGTRAVRTGEPAVGGWIEITTGLAAGDRVVLR